ncbi:MAG: FAD-binding protein, partial [Oceanipulchritudo sp.]
IYPAPHYTMGGLWVDYNLMTTIPGLFAAGECNFSDHGANRLGASALMQGLADGYFIVPYAVGNYLGSEIPIGKAGQFDTNHPAFAQAEDAVWEKIDRMMVIKGESSPRSIHIELGKIMLDKCGMARDAAGLKEAIDQIRALRERFWQDLKLPGTANELNIELERAGRVADHLEFAELMCRDALDRDESCGGHFRVEHQTADGEAQRDDENFSNVSVWEFKGLDQPPVKHVEPLAFEYVKPGVRSYK